MTFQHHVPKLQDHARDWARGVVDSIKVDIEAGESADLAFEVRGVVPHDEYEASRATDVPRGNGSDEWARGVWCAAFTRALYTAAGLAVPGRAPLEVPRHFNRIEAFG